MPNPSPFLRSPRREGPVSIRHAEPADLPAVEGIIARSPRAYAGLGGAMREAIQEDFGLTAWQAEKLAGFVMAYQQGPDVAWIHACGLAEDVSPSAVGGPLLHSLEQEADTAGLSWLAYMDEHGLAWLRHLLEEAGFRRRTRVVAYEAPLRAPPGAGHQGVRVRPVSPADIAAIAPLDLAAFGPLWAYGERVFASVLDAAGHFAAAEWEGQIVGYILCTLHRERAHVVRLAVHPRWQGRQIGVRLLAEAFSSFTLRGLRRISLNTQEENRRSQRLYHWFGFRQKTKGVGVWVKALGSRGEQR
jgi:ribosomal-protein-alanine N-acetyltransferase